MIRVHELVISKKHLSRLIGESKRKLPAESCALLIGAYSGPTANVAELFVTPNIDMSPVAFTMDPQDLFKAYTRAEEREMEVVGIFHSHPAPAKPSGVDVEFMKLNPVVWLILSNISWSYQAYQWGEDGVVDVKVVEK